MSPWAWSFVALASLVAAEVAIVLAGPAPPSWATPVRFAAAGGTFCPTMALLGAKRPQNRAWQLIVLSLWVILCLPSVEWLLFGGLTAIHPARFWFFAVLIAAAAGNRLGTRFWLAGLLYGGGQLALLWPFFSDRAATFGSTAPLVGIAGLVAAWVLVAAGWPRAREAELPVDRVWLDFRDAYGVVWALRVAERINASARTFDWPVQLAWRGFTARPGRRPAAEIPTGAEDGFRALLRRFVSADWIDARLGRTPREPRATASTN